MEQSSMSNPEQVLVSGGPPPYINLLHRLSRLGLATRYGGTNNRMVVFDLDDGDPIVGAQIREKWPSLRDAESIYLIYRNYEVTL